MAKKPIKVTEVVLRDAHQSLLATRMTMDEMRPILPEMDKINYFSVECWGGATFDSCIRFLDEDPWERLRILRKELPHQKLQMLFRGQNMLGYRPYADDAVEYFVQKSVANGIDVIRIFDALNDPRNLQTAIKSANKEGAHVQGCISYTLSPVHNNEYFAAYAKTLEEMGANSICIKDMAGLLTPYTCYDLVKKLKETVSIPVDIHSHYTAGLASMSILKGIEAGADIVDTAMSPLSLGTSHDLVVVDHLPSLFFRPLAQLLNVCVCLFPDTVGVRLGLFQILVSGIHQLPCLADLRRESPPHLVQNIQRFISLDLAKTA